MRAIKDRPGALHGVERVAAARVVQPGESVPGQHGPQPHPDDLPDRGQAERAQFHTTEPFRRQGAVQAHQRRFSGTEGQQNPVRLVPNPTEAEPEHASGGAVQPARVIHGDYQGRRARQDLQNLQDAPGQHPLIGRHTVRAGRQASQQRGLHGVPALFRERREDFPGISPNRSSSAEKASGRSAGSGWHDSTLGGRARRLQRMPPDSGLADPGIARDNKRRRPPKVSR